MIAEFIYHLTMLRSRKMICSRYSKSFWKSFQKDSDTAFRRLMQEFPDIGASMFAFNFAYAPSYTAWYLSMEKNGLDAGERDRLLLLMNEKMLTAVPVPLLHSVGKQYLNNMRRGAQKHVSRQNAGMLHPYDWTVAFQNIDKEHFNITITDCGFIKYARHYGAEGMLPAICQVDYMVSHYMNVGFERTGTLGAGAACCDGRYCLYGGCSWDMEERLKQRK